MGAKVLVSSEPCKRRTRPTSSGNPRLPHHDSHVVLPPTGEGQVDEGLAHRLRCIGPKQMLPDLLVRDVLGEAVGAQQHDVLPLQVQGPDLRIDLRAAKCAYQDVSERRSVGYRARPLPRICLLYTSDAADERSSVDLGGR